MRTVLATIMDAHAEGMTRVRAAWHRTPMPLIAIVVALQLVLVGALVVLVLTCGT